MAGTPKKRARREQAAKRALAHQENALQATKMTPEQVEAEAGKYTPELAAEIVELIAAGVPISDTYIGDKIALLGIESRVGISGRTIYKWQRGKPDFADAINKAREESSHRIADQIVALNEVALLDPAMANAVRVAQQGLQWSAMVRNRKTYGDKSEVTVNKPDSVGLGKELADEAMELIKKLARAHEVNYSLYVSPCPSCGQANIYGERDTRPDNCLACGSPIPKPQSPLPKLPLPRAERLPWLTEAQSTPGQAPDSEGAADSLH